MTSQQTLSLQQNLTIRLLRVLRYNKARIERALVLLPEERRPLFHVLPFLLHINHPDLPGYVDSDDVPYGLNNYSLRTEVTQALAESFPLQKALIDDIKQIWPRQRAIDALVLMGSIGTIAQADDSDFDYWVCVDGSALSPEAMAALQTKLTAIEKWAEQHHNIEVHFFLTEIDKVRQNDFGVAEGESAGSAQAVFLKAEFYTTNIVVAGKAPFWWLTPESTSDAQYYSLLNSLEKGGSPDASWFMDLGNLEQLDPNELFGAAIWQLGKAMDSPFKSVLKMAKLEVFLDNLGQEQPLCNLLKKRVHHGAEAPGQVANIDPYALMFDQLIAHFSAQEQDEVVLLLQQCLYIKCGCTLSVPLGEDEKITFKRRILAGYVKQWGWTRADLRHLDNIHDWSFQERVKMSRRIHRFLLQCYRRISAQLTMEKQSVSKEDMTVLGRRLNTFYGRKDHKIDFLRSAFDEKLYCSCVTVKVTRRKNNTELWTVYAGDKLSKSGRALEGSRIAQAASPIELMLWCVTNRILDSRSSILMDYDSEPVTEFDMEGLVKHLESVFPPVRVSTLPRDALLAPERVSSCMIVINFNISRIKATVEEQVVIYSTTWGETFLVPGKEALDTLWFELQEVSPRPPCYAVVPDGNHRHRLFNEFKESTELSVTLL
ncbi:class I adenylate cyclase [Alteromonas sp. CYL-A6]|uniref:class I adenylate cyclase n=1 Tax=Alteromonas nitratireducens TaxID=3390813 RepID=UPI0034BEA0E1